MKPKELVRALAHLKQADPVMAGLVEQFPLNTKQNKTLGKTELLEDLVSAIVSQQLSTKAADTIYRRFLALFDNKFPLPKVLVEMDEATLRGAGLSFAKIRYAKGIAAAVIIQEIDLEHLPDLPDEAVISELTKLKGVGRWTAEMFLMFTLNRPDVFSVGDLGLRTAIGRLYQIDRNDLPMVEAVTLPWKPYRTYASRLLWQSLDNK